MAKTDNQKKAANLRKAADLIMENMEWCDTPQGDDFWQAVYDELENRAEAAESGVDLKSGDIKVGNYTVQVKSIY